MQITFLGGGQMAQAIIGGLRQEGASFPIHVIDINPHVAESLRTMKVVCHSAPNAAALACTVLVLAVKPQQLLEALKATRPFLQNSLVLSIAAGVPLAALSHALGATPRLVRAMPNTPALIQQGISALYAAPTLDASDRHTAETILQAVGRTLWVEREAALDAVTAISGSGPAYVFFYIEALVRAAEALGLDAATAHTLAIETFVGASRLAQQSPRSLAELRQAVTSKGGTTEAALHVLQTTHTADHLMDATTAAQRRAVALAQQFAASLSASSS